MKTFLFIFLFIFSILFNLSAQDSHRDLIDVINYDINLDMTDIEGESIKGFTTVTATVSQNNLSIVYLDLLSLNIDSIKTSPVNITDFEYDGELITINLDSELNQGDNIEITVYYHGNPVEDAIWGGFYFRSGYAFNLGVAFDDVPHNYGRVWFPCIDDFTDKATYITKITTQQNHTAVCGGELVNEFENEQEGTKTYEWHLNDPIPTYLASVAVGEYEKYEFVYNGVEREIPVISYTLPNQLENIENSFVNMSNVLEIYEEKYGPYKWNRVGYVTVPFTFGGMEHATNVTISSVFINGTLNYEDLIYHELAHSWFGNLVTCSQAGDMWLNEGWAKYSESIYREFLYSRENMLAFRRTAHNTVLRYYHIQDGDFLAVSPMPNELTYSRTVYEKGASTAHSLRGFIGDDELFFGAISSLLDEYQFENFDSYLLRDFVADYTQIDLTDFFDEQVFTKGFVHYSIDSTIINQVGSDYQATVYMKQKLRGRDNFANGNKIEIAFLDDEFNTHTEFFEFDGEFGDNTFTIPFYPSLVLCDYYETFSDATIDETKIISSTGTYNYDEIYFKANVNVVDDENPALLRITHNWVGPDDFKEEVPGLIIANHRYWTVEGNFPQDFEASATFSYRNNMTGSGTLGHLDNDFITNSLDSLRLVYRPNRAADWTILEDVNHSVGLRTLKIDNLMAGEYSLAIYDWQQYANINDYYRKNHDINVYPNPGNGLFQVYYKDGFTGSVNIYNISGQLVHSLKVNDKTENLNLNCSHLDNGIYIIQIYNDNKIVKSQKLIINK